jgi:hypothetical protein
VGGNKHKGTIGTSERIETHSNNEKESSGRMKQTIIKMKKKRKREF